jgi:hypothetical protein
MTGGDLKFHIYNMGGEPGFTGSVYISFDSNEKIVIYEIYLIIIHNNIYYPLSTSL